MIASSTSFYTRNLILGFLYAAYPATQFFGAPILGELSDRFGRKAIINISTLGTGFAFFLTAISILEYNLTLLFISRLIGGFFAGNASLAQAAVSGVVDKKNRSRSMSLFTVIGGCSWIVGPFIGSFFSNPNIASWFGLDTPFWIFGFSFLICWGLFMISYQCMHVKQENAPLSITKIFKNLITIFHERIIVVPFTASLLAIFGWMIVQNFLSPFLMEKYSFTQHEVGYTYAYTSLWWLFGGVLAMMLFKHKRPSLFITSTTAIAAILILVYAVYKTPNFIIWAAGPANFCFSISYSGFIALFSHLLPENMQGRLYGSWTGGFALANTIAPALGGWISSLGINVPFLFASIIILVSALLYYPWYLNHLQKLKQHHA